MFGGKLMCIGIGMKKEIIDTIILMLEVLANGYKNGDITEAQYLQHSKMKKTFLERCMEQSLELS